MTRAKAKTSKPKPIDEWPEFDFGGVKQSEPEWEIMWDALAKASGDEDRAARDPVSGEAWQYMCSFRPQGTKKWQHEFRHRCHPKTQQRWVLHIEATPGWTYRKRDTPRRKGRAPAQRLTPGAKARARDGD